MEWNDLKSNKLFWVLVAVTAFNVGALLFGKVVIDRAADRVIQKLQKEYSPSPYGPGIDPDKVSLDALNSSRKYFEMRRRAENRVFGQEMTGVASRLDAVAGDADHWREDWERSRAISR
jgi:hypothetical protein